MMIFLALSSYDRFFPNQDILPKGGFGNLIALPIQRHAQNEGNSIFVDSDFKPIENQWEYLSSLKQYVGRIHRPFEGKKEVKIYDYLDPSMGFTISMFKKRLNAYKEMNYKVESAVGSKVDQLISQRDIFSEMK